MNHRKQGLLAAAAATALLWGPASLAHAQTTDGSVAPPAQEVGEVVVTAQKREQRLQDVPSSVSVVSASALEAKGATGLADLTKVVSGLQIIGGAGAGTGKPTIRGISSGTDRVALVGIYLDDLPFSSGSPRTTAVVGRALAFDPAFADIERIEVLKGPQSTLYGASTVGGLIKYVSKRPDPSKFEGSARVGASQVDGGGGGYATRLSVNVPLSENMAVRASAFYRQNPGFVTEVSRSEQNADRSTSKGVRASLLFENGDFENLLTGFVQSIHAKEASDVFLNVPSLDPTFGGPAFSSPIRQYQQYKYHAISNTTTVKLPFATLTNVAGYNGVFSRQLADYSVLTGAAANRFAQAFQPNNNKRWSDELRLASAPGQFEWMVGLWYTRETFRSENTFRATDGTGALVPPTDPLNNLYNLNNTATFKERAAFGNVTYHLTPELEATVGMRYSKNNHDFNAVGFGLFGDSTNSYPTSDSSKDYLATVTYKPTSTLTFYARAASGYRPGGPNNFLPASYAAGAPRSFKSDKLWNYEAGVKGSLLERRVSYELSVYHMDWKDVQVTQSFPLAGGGADVGVGNAGKAKSDGVEMAITAQLSDAITIGVNAAYNDARVTVDAPRVGAVSGNALPYAPKFSSNVFAEYRPHLTDTIDGLIGATYTYRGRQKAGFQNSSTPFTVPSYGTLDLRAGLDWEQYSLTVTVDNVTNEDDLTFVYGSNYKGGPLSGYTVRPRTYGVALEVKF